MSSNYIYEPFIKEQVSPVTSLTITHGFNRKVSVQVQKTSDQVDETVELIYPRIDPLNNNQVLIEFFSGEEAVAVGNFTVIIT